jgi:hypothetical protein
MEDKSDAEAASPLLPPVENHTTKRYSHHRAVNDYQLLK